MKITKSYDAKITAFYNAYIQARDGLKKAGEMLIELLDEDENAFEKIIQQCPDVTLAGLEVLEKIGRGKLLPEFATSNHPASELVIRRALTVEDQTRLLNHTVPVVVERNGGVEVINKRLTEIKVHEARRLIGEGKLHTPAEQIKAIELERERRAIANLRYELRDGSVRFRHDSEFTWSELNEICEKIKPKASDLQSALQQNQIKS